MTLLLMAAGKGSRYGALKQFDDLGPHGEFLMEFSIYDAIKVGFKRIVVVTQADQVTFLQAYLEERLPQEVSLVVIAQKLTDLPDGCMASEERQKPWGTAHAVWAARHVIKETFVVLNADDFYGKEAFKSAAKFLLSSTAPTHFGMVTYPLQRTLSIHGAVSRGICTLKNQILVHIEERTKLVKEGEAVLDLDSGTTYTGQEQISMNFWLCQPSFFEAIGKQLKTFVQQEVTHSKELYIPSIIASLIQDQKIQVHCIPSDSKWFGVTYAADRRTTVTKLLEMTQNHMYNAPLWSTTNTL